MAKKQTTKRKFDWTTYTRPARLLTPAQEDAFVSGGLAPLLALVLSDPDTRLDIRARSANVYYRGISLLRISGESPIVAELDESCRLPREERSGERLNRIEVIDATSTDRVIAVLSELMTAVADSWDPVQDASDRMARQIFAHGNSGDDLYAAEYVVIDMEHTYGARRYDLIALRRTEGVTGPGGFANCRLAFTEVRRSAKSLTGHNSLAAVAADLAEFTKAAGGEHLGRLCAECEELVAQKVRLGLLPADLEVRAIEVDLPELLVVIAGDEVYSDACDRAVIELHEKLTARHYPTDLLRFAHAPELAIGTGSFELCDQDAMSYRDFKSYRKHS